MSDHTTPFRRRALSLTSLIDVIFLLLLFFMLTTTFSRTGELALAVGGGGGDGDSAEAMLVFVRLGADTLTINGAQVAMAEAVAQITPLQGKTAIVLISAAPDATAQRLVDLLARLRGLPAARVQVLG